MSYRGRRSCTAAPVQQCSGPALKPISEVCELGSCLQHLHILVRKGLITLFYAAPCIALVTDLRTVVAQAGAVPDGVRHVPGVCTARWCMRRRHVLGCRAPRAPPPRSDPPAPSCGWPAGLGAHCAGRSSRSYEGCWSSIMRAAHKKLLKAFQCKGTCKQTSVNLIFKGIWWQVFVCCFGTMKHTRIALSYLYERA